MRLPGGCFVGFSFIWVARAVVLENRAVLPRYDNSTPSTSTAETLHVGDYIAAGLDLTTRSDTVVLSTSSIYSSAAPSRGYNVSSQRPNDLVGGVTTPNNNATAGGQCWSEWSDYWSISTHLKTVYTVLTTTRTIRSHLEFVGYTTGELTTTETAGDGNFATRTYLDTISTEWPLYTTVPTSTVATQTYTTRASANITIPHCILPTYVAQCQASWSAYATGAYEEGLPEPACTQASISGALCKTYVSRWLQVQTAEMGEIEGKVGMQLTVEPVTFTANGTATSVTTTSSYYWPTSSTVAPGCSVGCQSCRVSGSRVKLLHWPPETTAWRNGTFFATSTRHANATLTAPATFVTEGTTLTSPTVYISFDHLHASNSCNVIGKTLSKIIVAITNSATLSSLYGWDRYRGLQQTASFNFTDLYVTPVPSSIYQSQPRCASSSINMWYYSCLPQLSRASQACASIRTSGYECPRTLPYEPVLALPAEVRDLQPEWSDCIGGVIGVYDPPVALHAAAAEIKPTAPDAMTTTTIANAESTERATPAPSVTGFAAPTHSSHTSPIDRQSSRIQNAGSTSGEGNGPAAVAETTAASLVNAGPQTNTQQGQSLQSPDESGLDDSPPTDALGVLTQALTKSINLVTDGGSWSSVGKSSSLPSFGTIRPSDNGAGGDSGEDTLSSSRRSTYQEAGSDTASFVYDPVSTALLTADGHADTVLQVGTSIIVVNAVTTAVLQPGQTTVLNGKPIVLGPEGVAYGSTTIALFTPSTRSIAVTPATLVLAADEHTYTVGAVSNGVVVEGNGAVATMSNGAATTINGQAIAVENNGHVVLDGTSYSVPRPTAGTDAPVAPSVTAGFDMGSEVILPLASTTLIVSKGSQTIVSGITYSAQSSGGAIIVHANGTTGTIDAVRSSTQSLPRVLTAMPTSSTIPGSRPVDGSLGTSSTASSAAVRRSIQAQRWLVGLFSVLVCVHI